MPRPKIPPYGLLLLLAAAPLHAQPMQESKSLSIYTPAKNEPTQPPTTHVRALILQLASPDPDKHAAAERDLLALCPAIEPQLRYALVQEERITPAPFPDGTPMTQTYVRGGAFSRFEPADLLPRLAFHSLQALVQHCEELRRKNPATLTIHADNAPLSDIFRQLGEQVSAPVDIVARSFDGGVIPAALDWFQSARTTVSVDHLPYWQALRLILAAIHPPELRSASLTAEIGSNRVSLLPLPGREDIFRDPDAVVSGPLLLAFGISATPRLSVSAVIDPALPGYTGDSALHVDSLTDDHGQAIMHPVSDAALAREEPNIHTSDGLGFAPGDNNLSWLRTWPIESPKSGHSPAKAAGAFSIGFGAPAYLPHGYPSNNIGLSLTPFSAAVPANKPAEELVYLLQDCKVLQPPTFDQQVYSKDAFDCHARSIDRNRPGANGSNTIDGVMLTLANHRDHAVIYVGSLASFVDPAPNFPAPDQTVLGVGIFHIRAEPGETVLLRMATSSAAARRYVPKVFDRIPPPTTKIAPSTVVYDAWRLTADNVVHNGEIYEIYGHVVLPRNGPSGDTAVGAGYIFVRPVDAQGWEIESYPYFSKLRTEGDHLVEDFKVVTREPGRVPTTLVWQTPGATHWLTVPFTATQFHPVRATQ